MLIFISALIQSITEFLPISSSAHLYLFSMIFEKNPQNLSSILGLHIGTFLALSLYFYKDIFSLFKAFFIPKTDKKLLLFLIVATLPILIIGALFYSSLNQKNIFLLAFCLIFFGIPLWLADKYSPQKYTLKTIPLFSALLIGLAQSLSLIPGVSRLGVCLTTSRFCQLNKKDSIHLSFLLSLPVIFFSTVGLILTKHTSFWNTHFLYSVLLSLCFSLFFMTFLIRFLQRHSFFIFTLYRFFFAFIILFILFF